MDCGICQHVDDRRRATECAYPADGVDKDGCDCCVGSRLVCCNAGLQRHVYRHVDVRGELTAQASEEAAPSSDDIDQTPSEYHGEHELDNAVSSGRDQRAGLALDASILKYLRNVVGNTITSRPLSDRLHEHNEQEATTVRRHRDNLLDHVDERCASQIRNLLAPLCFDCFELFPHRDVGGVGSAEPRQGCQRFAVAIFGREPAWRVGHPKGEDEGYARGNERDGLHEPVLGTGRCHVGVGGVVDEEACSTRLAYMKSRLDNVSPTECEERQQCDHVQADHQPTPPRRRNLCQEERRSHGEGPCT